MVRPIRIEFLGVLDTSPRAATRACLACDMLAQKKIDEARRLTPDSGCALRLRFRIAAALH